MADGTIPALVSRADFDAVQARLAANKRFAARNNRNPEGALLRGGFARCGYCGHSATVNNGGQPRGGRQRNPTYGCHGWAKDYHGCPAYAVDVADLDAAVWDKIATRIKTRGLIAAEVARVRQQNPVEADLTALDRRLADIAKGQARLARSIAAVEDDDAAAPLQAELKALAAQKRRLDADRASLVVQQDAWQATKDRLAALDTHCRRVAGNLETMTYAEKRDLLTALDVRVLLYRADHTPRWEFSADFDGIVSTTASNFGGIAGSSLPMAVRTTADDSALVAGLQQVRRHAKDLNLAPGYVV
jgi:site-specific DNA recombinase